MGGERAPSYRLQSALASWRRTAARRPSKGAARDAGVSIDIKAPGRSFAGGSKTSASREKGLPNCHFRFRTNHEQYCAELDQCRPLVVRARPVRCIPAVFTANGPSNCNSRLTWREILERSQRDGRVGMPKVFTELKASVGRSSRRMRSCSSRALQSCIFHELPDEPERRGAMTSRK
jgi:hypothetical protein